jgi:hypothetical protein
VKTRREFKLPLSIWQTGQSLLVRVKCSRSQKMIQQRDRGIVQGVDDKGDIKRPPESLVPSINLYRAKTGPQKKPKDDEYLGPAQHAVK